MYQSVFLTFLLLVIILQMRTQGNSPKLLMGDSTTAGNQSQRVVTFKAVPGTERTYYYHRDHLGSTTLITNDSGEVVQRVEYQPTGETFIEQQDTSWVSPYKFNGRSALRDSFETTWRKKELDKMHGLDWYDSSARYYDHVLGRFHQIDALAEKYYSWSPYAYCHNNPVILVDPDGRDDYYTSSGKDNEKIFNYLENHPKWNKTTKYFKTALTDYKNSFK